jgi:nondiscriminating aspartyl-tRNA synthetase
MNRITTSELGQHIGERVRLAGWLHRLRKLSSVSFLILRDRCGTVQIVLTDPGQIDQLNSLYAESVLSVEGLAVASEQAPGGVEVHEAQITVLSGSAAPPTFDLFRPALKAQLPTQLDNAALSLRHPRRRALWQIASATMDGFRGTLRDLDFTEIQTPKIVASATESGANVFAIDYFGKAAYLAQSPQFYKQMMVGVFERVFEVGPVFRAEPHATTRHLTQYTSLDLEFGFVEDHTTVMHMLTAVLRGMVAGVARNAADAVSALGIALPEAPDRIPDIHFADAKGLILHETGEDTREEPDLNPAEEQFLGEWARREHGSDFLFVTGYPMVKRPFYTHPEPARPAYSNSFDLLFRGLELVTGGQRLHRYADYIGALGRAGMSMEPFAGYLDAFKHGMPPHGGCAIGLERWVARLTETANIREAALFPRDMQRLTP